MEGKDVEMTVCNLLANFIKMEKGRRGERRRSDCAVVGTAQSTSQLWPCGRSQEPGSLRKGPTWA